MIKTKKCRRCLNLFFPDTSRQVECPYCRGKKYPLKDNKCKIFGCDNKVGERGGRGLCPEHYSKVIREPRDKVRRLSQRTGFKICETYLNCEIFFKPTDKYHWARQKYCNNCRRIREKVQ